MGHKAFTVEQLENIEAGLEDYKGEGTVGSAYVSSYGLYNEGFLTGAWIPLPTDDFEDIYDLFAENSEYNDAELFASDVEFYVDGLHDASSENIFAMNKLAQVVADFIKGNGKDAMSIVMDYAENVDGNTDVSSIMEYIERFNEGEIFYDFFPSQWDLIDYYCREVRPDVDSIITDMLNWVGLDRMVEAAMYFMNTEEKPPYDYQQDFIFEAFGHARSSRDALSYITEENIVTYDDALNMILDNMGYDGTFVEKGVYEYLYFRDY